MPHNSDQLLMPLCFDLYSLKHFGLRTLLLSGSATTTILTFESPLHFYPFTLQGDTSNTLPRSDWSDNEMVLRFVG